jgi:hypothetical protein
VLLMYDMAEKSKATTAMKNVAFMVTGIIVEA